jgi:hypothetical protein
MKTFRYLAAGALALMGIVMMARLSSEARIEGEVATFFGIAYLTIAFFLMQGEKNAHWWGIFVPLVDFVISVKSWLTAPMYMNVYWLLSYAIVIGFCLYQVILDLRQKRITSLLHR